MLETRLRVVPSPLLEAASHDPIEIRRRVIACVAFDFRLDAAALEAPLRGSQRMAFARQIAMYLLHVVFGLSFDAVGRAFGRDRTTVAHACRVIEDGRDDIWFDCRVATLESICLGPSREVDQ
jgi:chromosomal replication initiation ATPase DnaA